MSRIISSPRTSWTVRTSACAVAANSLATTTSVGSGISVPRAFALAINRRATSSISASCSDLPTPTPVAARNVLAMPPPTISLSTFSSSDSSTVSLVETFEPPTIATSGRAGFSSALSSASSSPTSSGPAQATLANRATPWVLASARCAVPNASITNTSHSAAIFRASFSSSFFSPLLKRTFSHSTALPGRAVHAVEPVLAQRHRLAEQLRQARRNRREGQRLVVLALLGPAEMREDEHLRVLIERVADRRQRRADPRIARDHPVLHRHVEIFPDQDPLVAQVRIRHPQDLHDAFDQATVVSIMRLEKPHSLSYQANRPSPACRR